MKILWQVVACFLGLFVSICSFSQSKPVADLIITNAKVWTVEKSNPAAQAVAVLGERIVAVGSNTDVEPWRGSNTRVLDAGGKLLLPGFNDSHVHFIDGGMQLDAVQLNDVTNPQEFARRIGDKAKKTATPRTIQVPPLKGLRIVFTPLNSYAKVAELSSGSLG